MKVSTVVVFGLLSLFCSNGVSAQGLDSLIRLVSNDLDFRKMVKHLDSTTEVTRNEILNGTYKSKIKVSDAEFKRLIDSLQNAPNNNLNDLPLEIFSKIYTNPEEQKMRYELMYLLNGKYKNLGKTLGEAERKKVIQEAYDRVAEELRAY